MMTAIQLSRFFRLPGRDQQLLIAAAMVWLPGAWLGLRLLGLQRLQRWLARGRHRTTSVLPSKEVEHLAKLVETAARHTFAPSTCLTRSLALIWVLGRQGVDARLRIGVRLENGTLDAHAWVEYRGLPVNDPQHIAALFAPFADFLPPSSFQSR